MERLPIAVTVKQKILAALARIESKLNRVKRIVRG
jgi:hypothetical protein